MRKNTKSDGTSKVERPQEIVSVKDESSPKVSPPMVTFQSEKEIRNHQKRSDISELSQGLGEDERFFLDLYPELRRSLLAYLRRRFSSSPLSFGRNRPVVEDIYLQREFGLFDSLNYLLISSIGTGLYLSPGVILRKTGSITEALIIWLFSGIFSYLIAITYGELICLITQSGARFSFLLAAFSSFHSFFGPLPAFLSILIDILFLGPARVSLLTLLIAENMYFPLITTVKTYYNFEVTEPIVLKKAIGIAVLAIITSINFRSIKTCVRILRVFGCLKWLFFIAVISCGIYTLSTGHTQNLELLFKDMKGNTTGLVKAFHTGMWAYSGWNQVVTIAEEIKNPSWTIPHTVLMGLPLVTFFYLSMNVMFFSVLSPKDLTEESSKFIFKFGEKLFGSRGIMPVCFAISALSCAICVQLGCSRSCFAAGREGHMPELHSYLNVKRLVPTPAIITQAFISLIYIIYIPLLDLIEFCGFISWTFYGFAFCALIILRVKMPQTYRLYKTPLCLPIILTTISVLVTLHPLFTSTAQSSLTTAAAFICIGIFVYFKTVYNQKKLICMDQINGLIRKVLNVAEPTALPEGYTHPETRAKTVGNRLRNKERYYSTINSH